MVNEYKLAIGGDYIGANAIVVLAPASLVGAISKLATNIVTQIVKGRFDAVISHTATSAPTITIKGRK